jgi:hypothetical protein
MLTNIRIGVRKVLKGQDLSFTEIAKLVGERWQVLRPDVRDACELEAATAKERHSSELSEYKRSQKYAQYQQYLEDFRFKHTRPQSGTRRKLSNLLSSWESHTHPERERSSTVAESPTKANSSSRSGHNKLGEETPSPEASTTTHQRSLSNASKRQVSSSVYTMHAPSASTSPTAYSTDTQSSITLHTYSQQLNSPVCAGIYGCYKLRHLAELGHSSTEFQTREAAIAGDVQVSLATKAQENESTSAGHLPAGSHSRWQSQSDKYNHQALARCHFLSGPPSPSGSFVLPLIQSDITYPSQSGALPPTSYQEALLLPLNALNGDRTLPPPIRSRAAGTIASPIDSRRILFPPSTYTSQLANQDFEEGTQWSALLHATQLALDADSRSKRQTLL